MTFLSLLSISLFLTSTRTSNPQTPLISNPPPSIPKLGFGTWNLKEANNSAAVSLALQTGYLHLDCAAIYGNEKEVGAGITDGLEKTGKRREDIWITSKLWNDHHDPDLVEEALEQTLSDLGVQYLDLYLMHWPVASSAHGGNEIDYLDTWHAMSHLPSTGKVRHIGISNFSPSQIKDLIAHSEIKPAVHQMELHPYLPQTAWVNWHVRHGINVTAYSPLGNSNPIYDSHSIPPPLLQNPTISSIAKARNCTPAQVALSWGMGREGVNVIPKSGHAGRIRENFETRNCVLNDDDLREMEVLGKAEMKRFNNPSEGWGVDLFDGLEGV